MNDSDDSVERPARSLRTQVAALLVAGLLCWPLLVGIAFLVGPTVVGGALVVLIGTVIALAWRRPVSVESPAENGTEPPTDHSSVWNAIPPWQYEGRLAESGGITHSEQERALRDIQRQAEELAEDSSEQ